MILTFSVYFGLWFVISSGPVEMNYPMWMLMADIFCVFVYIMIGKIFKKIMIKKFNKKTEEYLNKSEEKVIEENSLEEVETTERKRRTRD